MGANSATETTVIRIEQLRVACSKCNLKELCMPPKLDDGDLEKIDTLVTNRRRIKKGAFLFSDGDVFTSLFAVRTGFFKTSVTTEDGRDQVTGFQMAGEILGLDGIVNDRHTCSAIALEDSEICLLPYEKIEEISREVAGLQRHLHKILSREIVRDNNVMLLLGSMRAEERLATFLLNLAQRLGTRGFSTTEFVLRMTREEIGSYLGLKIETVSRLFSRFVDDGLLEVKQKQVRLLDMDRLKQIASSSSQAAC